MMSWFALWKLRPTWGLEAQRGSVASGHAGHAGPTKSMAAHWTATLKLPKRRRIVFSDGLIPAWVHEAAVGEVPRSATKRRTASSAWSEARLPFKPKRRRRPPNSKVFELCMAGPTKFLRSRIASFQSHDQPLELGGAGPPGDKHREMIEARLFDRTVQAIELGSSSRTSNHEERGNFAPQCVCSGRRLVGTPRRAA
jgi:hypothetical protein